jgi:acid phosphatase family membrane protein YuiD
MGIVKQIVTNHMLIAPIISWAVCQVLKVITNLIATKEFDIKKITSDGGMPSAHTATVISLAVVAGWVEGYNSAIFAVALVFAVVIMRDAVGVRRETGKNASAIKRLSNKVSKLSSSDEKDGETEKLKTVSGHTPIQVAAGFVAGVIVGILYIIIVF